VVSARRTELGQVGYLGDLPSHDHAPAGVRGPVGPVHLEADLAAAAGGVQHGSCFGAEHHGVPVEDEIEGAHDRPAVVDDGQPAEILVRQQFEAFRLGQLLPADPPLIRRPG
jgi:hypothetical protein